MAVALKLQITCDVCKAPVDTTGYLECDRGEHYLTSASVEPNLPEGWRRVYKRLWTFSSPMNHVCSEECEAKWKFNEGTG